VKSAPKVLRRCCSPILLLVAVALATGACHHGGGGDNNKWMLVGGDGTRDNWDVVAGGFEEVRVLQVYQGKIYAGLVNPTLRQGQVWEYDGVSWCQVAGDGIMGSWPSSSVMSVDSLAADGGYLYAGTGSTSSWYFRAPYTLPPVVPRDPQACGGSMVGPGKKSADTGLMAQPGTPGRAPRARTGFIP